MEALRGWGRAEHGKRLPQGNGESAIFQKEVRADSFTNNSQFLVIIFSPRAFLRLQGAIHKISHRFEPTGAVLFNLSYFLLNSHPFLQQLEPMRNFMDSALQ